MRSYEMVDSTRVEALKCLHGVEDRLKNRIFDTNRQLDDFNR